MKQYIMTGNLKKDYARFCVSCVLNLLVFSLYSIVDGLFVSHFVGADALAAVDLCLPTMNVMYFVGITMAIGSGTMIATELGAGRGKTAGGIFTQNILVTTLLGLLFSLLGILFIKPLSHFLGGDERTASMVQEYMGTLAPFFVFVISEYSLESLIKVQGSPELSMVTVLSCCLLNVFGDWLLMGPLHMGIRGAALATGLANTVATAIFLTRIVFGKKGTFRFTRFRLNPGVTVRAFCLGIADGSVEISAAVMLWIYNRLIQYNLGADGVAAFSVITFAAVLVENVVIGVGQGIEPLVSYSNGANRPEDRKKILKYGLITGAVVSLVSLVLVELAAPDIGALFLERGSEAWTISLRLLRFYSLTFLGVWINMIIAAYMTAIQKPGPALLISLGRAILVHLVLLVGLYLLFGVEALLFCSPLTELVVAVFSVWVLKKTDK